MKRSIWLCALMVVGMMSVPWLSMADEDDENMGKGMRGHGQGAYSSSGMRGGHSMLGQGMRRHHGSFSLEALKDQLGLTQEQIGQLRPLETDYRKTMIRNQADLRVAMIDMGSLVDQETPNMAALRKKIDEIGDLKKQFMMYRLETLLKLKDILNADQYRKFRTWLRQQMEGGAPGGRMHGMGSMMPGHGQRGMPGASNP